MAARGDDLHAGRPGEPAADAGAEIAVPADYDYAHGLFRLKLDRILTPRDRCFAVDCGAAAQTFRLETVHRRLDDIPQERKSPSMKIPKRLEPLVEAGLVDAVVRQLMSGRRP